MSSRAPIKPFIYCWSKMIAHQFRLVITYVHTNSHRLRSRAPVPMAMGHGAAVRAPGRAAPARQNAASGRRAPTGPCASAGQPVAGRSERRRRRLRGLAVASTSATPAPATRGARVFCARCQSTRQHVHRRVRHGCGGYGTRCRRNSITSPAAALRCPRSRSADAYLFPSHVSRALASLSRSRSSTPRGS